MKKSCALVLAAGFSKRYGEDKRLSSSKPMVMQTLQKVCECFEDVYLVHRANDPDFLKCIEAYNVTCIAAPLTDISLGTSIATGINAIQKCGEYSVCAVFLADMPYISTDTISNLLKISQEERIVRPQYKGKEGHPVLFGKNFFADLLTLEGKKGAYSVLETHGHVLDSVEVSDQGCVFDIDRPEDKEKYEKQFLSYS